MAAALPTGARGRALALALLAVVLGLAWVAVGAPLVAWHTERAERLVGREALARRMEALAATLPALRRQVAGGEAGVEPKARALLEGGSDAIAGAALQDQVAAMARRSGLTLASAESLPAEVAGGFRRLRLRVSVSGPWPELMGLLREVAVASPRMLVDDLQMQAGMSVTAGAAQPVGATFTVVAFRAGGAG